MTAHWVRGHQIDRGTEAAFYAITKQKTGSPLPPEPGWQRIGAIAHVSDLHITDTESPARLDFLIETATDPRFEQNLPTPRPQQLTSSHAAAATLATIQRLADQGIVDAAVLTGDLVDNGQANEFQMLHNLFTGAEVRPSLNGEQLEGTQTQSWSSAKVWQPGNRDNYWASHFGFPAGNALARALARPFRLTPLTIPTALCRGNHDALLAGWIPWQEDLATIATGTTKAHELPAGYLHDHAVQQLRKDPVQFLGGPSTNVTPFATRAPLPASEFPLSFNSTLSYLEGTDGVLEVTEDLLVMIIDTSDQRGLPNGAISQEQACWVENTLTSITDTKPTAAVLIASHHGPHDHPSEPAPGMLAGQETVNLLGQHTNVLAWLTGHTHMASLRTHIAASGRSIVEINAPSIIDWPCQFQTIQVWKNGDGYRLVVTKHDFDAPTNFDGTWDQPQLAHLHRCLAANQADFGIIFPGLEQLDENNYVINVDPSEATA